MAVRIPDARQLQRQVPSAQRQISVDRSGEIYAEGAQEIAGIFKRREERRDRFNYGKARSALLQADIEARRSLEEDPDWANYETKYRDNMKKAREAASAMISDPTDRAFFEQETTIDIDRGALVIHGLSKQKEADVGRADLEAGLLTNSTAAMNAKDEATRTALVKATSDLLTGAARKGWITNEAAQLTGQKWTASYGRSYLEMLPVEERIRVLNNPKGTPADYVAPDDRALLLRNAQNENKETRVRAAGQKAEDEIWAAGGSLESMRAKARKIEDPEVRDSAITRLEARANDREEDRNRYDTANRRAAWDIFNRTGNLDDIPPDLVARMDPEDWARMKASAGKDVETDIPTWYGLIQMAGEDPKAFIAEDLLKYMDRLGEEDFQKFSELQKSMKEDVRTGDPVQTDNQIVTGALRELGIKTVGKIPDRDAVRAANFRYAFGKAINDQFRATGKQPTIEDKEIIKKRLMTEVVTGSDWFGLVTTTAPLFEAPAVVDVVIPKDERKQVIAALTRAGIEPTEENIRNLYLRGRGF